MSQIAGFATERRLGLVLYHFQGILHRDCRISQYTTYQRLLADMKVEYILSDVYGVCILFVGEECARETPERTRDLDHVLTSLPSPVFSHGMAPSGDPQA